VNKPWPDIEQFYRNLSRSFPDASFRQAFDAVGDLAAYVCAGPLALELFGWTSMHDLCIQQVDVEPHSGPFLKISPRQDGTVEFRYYDTHIEARQWSRVVPPHGVRGRFEAFLNQLHWTVLRSA
jgi:hypothetical protein